MSKLTCKQCGSDVPITPETTKMEEVELHDADGEPVYEFAGQPAQKKTPVAVCQVCGSEVVV